MANQMEKGKSVFCYRNYKSLDEVGAVLCVDKFVMSVSFHGVNTPIVVDSKLPT